MLEWVGGQPDHGEWKPCLPVPNKRGICSRVRSMSGSIWTEMREKTPNPLKVLARPERFERPTLRFVV